MKKSLVFKMLGIMVIFMILTSLVIIPGTVSAGTGKLEIHMISAGDGRGDCFLIVLPNNVKMVVDIAEGYKDALINKLNELGYGGGIKYLVGTHEHVDHIGGMDNFLNSGFTINNTEIYYPKGAINANSAHYNNLVQAANSRGLTIKKLVAGDYIVNNSWDGKPFSVKVIGPEQFKIDGGSDDWGCENEASLALKITYDKKSILMMADNYGSNELRLLEGPYANEINSCEVLKVGHHGVSANGALSCRPAFLDAAGIKKALITNGDMAINAEIKSRLQERNINYWSTKQGYVYLWTDGSSNWTANIDPLWPK